MEGHSKESISAFVNAECREEGTGLIEMDTSKAILHLILRGSLLCLICGKFHQGLGVYNTLRSLP